MDVTDIVARQYRVFRGADAGEIEPLKGSGSYRRYFRIREGSGSVIAAYNEKREENEAFVGFSDHFRKLSLPVPEVYEYYPDACTYFLEDLGRVNLYEWLTGDKGIAGFGEEASAVYRLSLEQLARFQTEGFEGLNLDLCYPHRSFDSRSMMWDMNYFKYMFLNLLAVPYHERKLEHDFETLRDFLQAAPQEYFLYRDFQSANIMLREGQPWFIDYQGGRRGAPQYDVASLLYDAKAHIPGTIRKMLLGQYLDVLEKTGRMDRQEFLGYYPAFALVRLMQALGAFGFRGLYEKKATFTESIVPAVELLNGILDEGEPGVELKELFRTIRHIDSVRRYRELADNVTDVHKAT